MTMFTLATRVAMIGGVVIAVLMFVVGEPYADRFACYDIGMLAGLALAWAYVEKCR